MLCFNKQDEIIYLVLVIQSAKGVHSLLLLLDQTMQEGSVKLFGKRKGQAKLGKEMFAGQGQMMTDHKNHSSI